MAATLTVKVDLPDGVDVDASDYRLSHGGPPDFHAYGSWMFGPLAPGGATVPFDGRPETATITLAGTLEDVLDRLPPGFYALLP